MTELLDLDAINRVLAAVAVVGGAPTDSPTHQWRRKLAQKVSFGWTMVTISSPGTSKQVADELSKIEGAADRLARYLHDARPLVRHRLAQSGRGPVSEWIDSAVNIAAAAREARHRRDDLVSEPVVQIDGSVPAFVTHMAQVFRWAFGVDAVVLYDGASTPTSDGPFFAFMAATVREMSAIGNRAPMVVTPDAVAQAMKPSRSRRNPA